MILPVRRFAALVGVLFTAWYGIADADAPGPSEPLTTIVCRDREDPSVGAAAIEWEVAHNTYTLNRATLELDVIGRVYVCQRAQRQL